MDPVEQVIANLRTWRALPGYSVERRLDVLLTPYLEGFLTKQMGGKVELVTAEFPLPKTLFPKLLGGKDPKRQHVSADFLCIRRGEDPAWILVELKTDAASRRSVQDAAYAEICASCRMEDVLAALSSTKRGTKHGSGYEAVARLVRRAARGAGKVEKLELCYLEPIVGKVAVRAGDAGAPERGAVTWRLGLGKLAAHIPAGDAFGRMLQKVLRGIARSEKGRRTKDRRPSGGAG
jgi:hypothetical protein